MKFCTCARSASSNPSCPSTSAMRIPEFVCRADPLGFGGRSCRPGDSRTGSSCAMRFYGQLHPLFRPELAFEAFNKQIPRRAHGIERGHQLDSDAAFPVDLRLEFAQAILEL